nr:MAG TPA: INTRON-ENCODED HOMING ENDONUCLEASE I-PPOI [Caudoviricetes sp.]
MPENAGDQHRPPHIKPTTWDYKRIAQRSTHRLADQNPPFLLRPQTITLRCHVALVSDGLLYTWTTYV